MFIGSSREGQNAAEAIRCNLDRKMKEEDVAPWYSGKVFQIGDECTLEGLKRALNEFTSAILVFTPDDQVTTRENECKKPRDNVIFETGLFMGHLGLDHVFVCVQSDKKMIMPTDIDSLVVGHFKNMGNFKSLQEELEPICEKILDKLVNTALPRPPATVPIYPNRFNFMENELVDFINGSKESVEIANIIFTILSRNINVKNVIIKKLLDPEQSIDKFEILLVKRKRRPEDISYLKMRTDDEDNHGLIPKANRTLFELFLFLLRDIYPVEKSETTNNGVVAFRNFDVKEYAFAPIMCLYMFDKKDIVFGPYISALCESIPMFHIKYIDDDSSFEGAFKQLKLHYQTLSDRNARIDKQNVGRFSYFDGVINKSIHELIESHSKELNTYLDNEDLLSRYCHYLEEEPDNKFDDETIRELNEFEGRFDAVMRHICRELNIN